VYRTFDELEPGLSHVAAAPPDDGRLELVVRRPAAGDREVLDRGRLDTELGLVGDRWSRGSRPSRERQVTLMNWRATALFSPEVSRRPLAGDQLYVDLDLSGSNLPAGTRLAIGDAVVEITEPPHRGCAKFSARFGPDARVMVNSPAGIALNLRGVNGRVVSSGDVVVGDAVRKL
jgi:MOSC domain-containing protein YiiM